MHFWNANPADAGISVTTPAPLHLANASGPH
jgi:hypothetical protein